MDSQQLRTLKHELRTPVNHILGYSELILDAANDAGDSRAAFEAQNLHAIGQALARLVETTLARSDTGSDEDQISILRNQLPPIIAQIRVVAVPDSGLVAVDGCVTDLKRICQAADQLMHLVGNGNMVAAK